jgi:bacillopeptidase F (M6 metalloprotease family)
VKESWTHSAGAGIDDWGPSTARAHSPVTSYFSSEPATVKDDYLLTRAITVPANGQLSFWHTYKMESGYDGSVIEISTDNGATFTDLGSHIISGGYNGVISNRFGNPIGGRQAWTGGVLGAWSQVVVDLESYAGQNMIVRFRLATDMGKAGSGWYIDDVRVSG